MPHASENALTHSLPPAWPAAQLERVASCPVCGSGERRVLYENLTDAVFRCADGTWTLHRCGQCASAYLDPRPDESSIGRAYGVYFTHTAPDPPGQGANPVKLTDRWDAAYFNARYGYRIRNAAGAGRFVLPLWTLRRAARDKDVRALHLPVGGGHLLDLGYGNGGFVAKMQRLGWDAQGLEVDAAAVNVAREAGLNVTQGRLEDAGFADAQFHAVTMNHVIEHLHDVPGTLAECFRILKPGGTLWIATPNLNSRGHAVFGRHWIGVDPPRHLVVMTPDALRGALTRVGFRVTGHQGTPLAKWFYAASDALRRGEMPFNAPGPAPAAVKRKARIANILGVLFPARAEELVMLAEK